MNRLLLTESSILIRLVIAVGLAGLALALFLIQRSHSSAGSGSVARTREEVTLLLPQLDQEIDTILTSFGIEKRWIRKRSVPLDGFSVTAFERRIVLPADIIPVRINAGLAMISRRYRAKTFAGEDSKSRTVTIRIEMDGIVCQTFVLKTVNNLRQTTPGGKKTGAQAEYEHRFAFQSLTNT